MLHEDFETATEQCSSDLLLKIQTATRTIEADVDNFQGKRDGLPLFKVDPDLGKEAEALLAHLQESKKRIDKLAEPARKQAADLYGLDLLSSGNALTEVGDSQGCRGRNCD